MAATRKGAMTMSGWTVTIEAAGTRPAGATFERLLAKLGELLADHAAVISHNPDHTLYAATFSMSFPDADPIAPFTTTIDAVHHMAVDYFTAAATKAGLPKWPIWFAEVQADDRADAELEKPNYPDLVGVAEVAKMLNVTKQRISALRTKPHFPAPLAELDSGPVWDRTALGNFLATWTRKTGRPPKPPEGYATHNTTATVSVSTGETADDLAAKVGR